MVKELKFKQIIETIICEINSAKTNSSAIHNAGNIKASGDEIEGLVRAKISLFLPERYLVKQGHVVNSEGKVSNQFDIIIFDRLNTPKFFESNSSTVFYPIESVLAVGEIKKTLRKNDLIEFGQKIKYLKQDMKRKLIANTVYNGQIRGESSLLDLVSMRTDRKYKNPLFSFLFAIDHEDIHDLSFDDAGKYMPNDVYVLNYGCLLYGNTENKSINTFVEDEKPYMDTWIDIKKSGVNCFSIMLNQIIEHLNKCQIEPYSISHYMSDPVDFGIVGKDVRVFGLMKKDET
ncbi:MAG: hypothetical protein JW783_10260 [Bacteroidales bacterium]|nr:hypothetical protein [Bacteroidales bacterium]MBN2748937.1 hypothetical protein [Bacteroidales bacterium]